MLYAIKIVDDLEKLEELVALQNQVKLLDYRKGLVNRIFTEI